MNLSDRYQKRCQAHGYKAVLSFTEEQKLLNKAWALQITHLEFPKSYINVRMVLYIVSSSIIRFTFYLSKLKNLVPNVCNLKSLIFHNVCNQTNYLEIISAGYLNHLKGKNMKVFFDCSIQSADQESEIKVCEVMVTKRWPRLTAKTNMPRSQRQCKLAHKKAILTCNVVVNY